MKRIMSRIAAMAAAIAACMALASCGFAGQRSKSDGTRQQNAAISGDADASKADASYQEAIGNIRNSGSKEGKQILADNTITEEELVQLGSAYAQCLTSKGVTVDTGEARYPGGAIGPSYGDGDDSLDKRNLDEDRIEAVNSANEECLNETQYKNILDLYLELKENPGNVDSEQLARQQNDKTLACLKKHGIVDDSITADMYDELVTNGETGGVSFDDLIGKYTLKDNPSYDKQKATAIEQCGAL